MRKIFGMCDCIRKEEPIINPTIKRLWTEAEQRELLSLYALGILFP